MTDHCEVTRLRSDRSGLLRWYPRHTPLISIQSLSCGRTPQRLTTYDCPSFTLEDERTVVVNLSATTASWVGALQLGPAVDEMLHVVWRYTTGLHPSAEAEPV